MTEDERAIGDALIAVKERMARAALAARRAPDSVSLIAVSKTQPAERLRAAVAAGQRVFGENRVQEAEARWPAIRGDHPDLVLHLIGPLQTNKTKAAVALFDVIQTVDRPSLAESLASEFARSGRRLDCFIQVNTGEEAQKAGVLPADADAFIEDCRARLGLPIVGLMCIPPVDEEAGPHFALLADMAKRHGLARLSMGMSGDYELAIRFGATEVRVGTAIFGARPTP